MLAKLRRRHPILARWMRGRPMYGERDDGLVIALPREGAPEGLKAGESVRMGNGRTVTIVEITDETVVIDANHRLAGQTLTFEIEVVSIN